MDSRAAIYILWNSRAAIYRAVRKTGYPVLFLG